MIFKGVRKIIQKKPELTLGLDIDERKIDMVQIESTGSGPKLVNFVRSTIPEGVVDNGLIMDIAHVTKTIRAMLRSSGIKNCNISTSVKGSGTVVAIKKLDLKQKGGLQTALRQEAGNYLTFAGSEAVVDGFSLEEIIEDRQRKQRVFLGVARKEIIDAYLETLEGTGYEVDSVGLGVIEELRAIYPGYSDTIAVLIILGPNTSHIFLVNRGIVDFLHIVDLNPDERKEEFVRHLSIEINNVITYAREFEGIPSIEKVALSGDLSGIDSFYAEAELGKEIGVDVEIADPLKGIEIASNINRQELSQITGGIGLAMRAAGYNPFPSDINLLPAEELQEKELKGQIRQFLAGIAVVLIVIILGFVSARLVIKNLEKQTGLASDILDQPTPVIAKLIGIENSFRDGKKELMNAERIIADVHSRKWSEFLNEIKIIIPKSARLTRIISGQNGEIGISGEAASQAAVFDFVKNLKESPYFIDIELKTTKDAVKMKTVLTEYNITGKLYFYRKTK